MILESPIVLIVVLVSLFSCILVDIFRYRDESMLVLKRKVGERIMVGDDIIVTVCTIDHQGVKIGIDAPDGVEVHREEIYHQRQREKRFGLPPKRDRTND